MRIKLEDTLKGSEFSKAAQHVVGSKSIKPSPPDLQHSLHAVSSRHAVEKSL